MRKLLFLFGFFVVTHVLLLINIICGLTLSANRNNNAPSISTIHVNVASVAYAAVPNAEGLVQTSIQQADGRVENVQQFLNYYHSPLAPLASQIVSDADKYRIDYRLIPAIAMVESTGCHVIPVDSYNCWGFGIYGKQVTRFSSYSEAITTVTRTLANNYIARGLVSPAEIMSMWNPSSPNGSWATNVTSFMSEL